MRTLTIIDTSSHLHEIHLDDYGKRRLVFGRSREECDVVITDPIISKIHGVFFFQGSKTKYADCESSNGTYIEEPGQNRLLNRRDDYVEVYDKAIFRIGSLEEPDKMILMLYRVTMENETWKSQVLGDQLIHIGRSSENEIVLRHPGVSKVHCQIRKENQQYILYDHKSANGVMVNGKAVRESVLLKDKDIIQILDFQLCFSNECIYYMAQMHGISLRACGINKFVGSGRKRKQILQDVNCEIQGNEFVAIIGGSGAGKTTLMNAISGFEPDFEGNVFCNGIDLAEQFQNLKNIIGFVPQQDIIYENLTLKRMLYYTAKLKMPEDTLSTEIKERIREVLKMVDLEEHQETYIRKLSGGQKKRASIAVELLADPKLFFLDEPTSGLDPGTEKNLMLTLSRLSKEQHKTIIMVTHTTQNLHLCDKVIFMGSGGRLCFCGNVNAAKAFYQTDDLVNIYNMIAEDPEGWAQRFAERNPVGRIRMNHQEEKEELLKPRKESAFRQFLILLCRYAELMKNDYYRLLVLLVQPLLIAVLLYVVADKEIFDIYESTKSMLFALSCSGIWIGLFNSIQEICKERVILKREYMANLKLPGYVISKFVLQAVLSFVQAWILTFAFLKLIDKKRSGIFIENFNIEIFFTVWLTVLVAITMGFVISSMVKSGDKAMAIAPFVLIIQLLFSGILFTLKGAGEFISYCTISRWSVESLGSIADLNELQLKLQKDYPMLEHEAEDFFKATGGHVLQSWMILIVMTGLFMGISIVMLRNISKDRR